MNAKKLAFGAILTALSVALLWIGSIAPTGRAALTAIASLLPATIVIYSGVPTGFLVYGSTAVLSLLLLPNKSCAIAYTAILGWYGPTKSLIERKSNLLTEWILKGILFVFVSCVFYIAFRSVLLSFLPELLVDYAWAVIPVMVVFYVLYDILFTGLITTYQRRFASKFKL